MKYKVFIQAEAKDDFLELHAYLRRRHGAESAKRFKKSFFSLLEVLASSPFMFEAFPDRKNIRKCSALSPCLVIYEVLEAQKRVEIRAVYDGRLDRKTF